MISQSYMYTLAGQRVMPPSQFDGPKCRTLWSEGARGQTLNISVVDLVYIEQSRR